MGKYLKKFENHDSYELFITSGDYPKPNVSYCVQENEVYYNPYKLFCKLTLKNGSIVELEGSGELTSAMTSSYKSSVVSAEIGEACTSIGESAFSNCSGLTSVDIPSSVTSIGDYAFTSCGGLTSINIPNSVTSIGSTAFAGCRGLTSVTIGSGVTSIGSYAFNRCTSLTSIDIPSGVTSIGSGAFVSCSGLTSMTVDSSNTTYDSRNNCNAIIKTSTNELICGCKNTVIPSNVTSIGDYAFSGCTSLTSCTFEENSQLTSIGYSAFERCSSLASIDIPNSVTNIGASAFRDCTSLTSVTIPDSVTSIGSTTFQSCSGLTSVTIPDSVTSIGNSAFSNCSGLISVTSNATTAPTIQTYTFYNVKTNGTLTVLAGSTGYDVWMGTGNYYLGKYGWTKVEQ